MFLTAKQARESLRYHAQREAAMRRARAREVKPAPVVQTVEPLPAPPIVPSGAICERCGKQFTRNFVPYLHIKNCKGQTDADAS